MKYVCFGKTPLYERERLAAVLAAMLDSDTAPTHWGTEDGGKREVIDLTAMLSLVEGTPSTRELYLQRRTAPSWAGSVRLSRRPGISLVGTFQTTTMFDMLDDAFCPDVAVAWLGPELPQSWSDVDERDVCYIAACASLAPVDYYRVGPRGLSLRTVFGPHYVDQFGRDALLDTPATLTELEWGGVRIELTSGRFDEHLDEALATWRAAMTHLEPAGIFAPPKIDEERHRIRLQTTRPGGGPSAVSSPR